MPLLYWPPGPPQWSASTHRRDGQMCCLVRYWATNREGPSDCVLLIGDLNWFETFKGEDDR